MICVKSDIRTNDSKHQNEHVNISEASLTTTTTTTTKTTTTKTTTTKTTTMTTTITTTKRTYDIINAHFAGKSDLDGILSLLNIL